MKKKLKLGMVGGGNTGYIGYVHRIAARFDDHYELVAGALSSNPQVAHESAACLGIFTDRSYVDYQQMADSESSRDDGIDVVAIVTPNYLHAPVAKAFLNAGIHVICDKPLALTLLEGEELRELSIQKKKIFAVTYTYSGYPMVRHAKEMVANGDIGDIRYIHVEYLQDWLATAVEQENNPKAAWRTDPSKAGTAGCLGDIATHAFHLAKFISGLNVNKLSAQLSSLVNNRKVDDHVQISIEYEKGAKGTLVASQIATGECNGLRIRIYGTKASLRWEQEDPDYLWLTPLHGHSTRLNKGRVDSVAARHATRFPAGHPEGFFEAFAQLYTDTALQIRANDLQLTIPCESRLLTNINDGVEGMRFIEAALQSSVENGAFIRY